MNKNNPFDYIFNIEKFSLKNIKYTQQAKKNNRIFGKNETEKFFNIMKTKRINNEIDKENNFEENFTEKNFNFEFPKVMNYKISYDEDFCSNFLVTFENDLEDKINDKIKYYEFQNN